MKGIKMTNSGGLRLTMIRENLSNLPEAQLPSGYSIQWFELGMEKDWVRIQQKAETFLKIDSEKYKKEFADLRVELSQRQCFIKNNKGELVGTATAWFDSAFRGEGWGRVHWVAIIPEEQGKKLSNFLLLTVLQRINQLNCQKAYLVTSSKRAVAIRLYSKFGFVPNVAAKEDLDAWNEYLEFSKKNI